MFRVALLRASALPALRQAAALRATGPAMRFVRLESTDAKDPRRQLLEARDDLQRDWDAKELSYEELKPKTLQPSPASLYIISTLKCAHRCSGSVPNRRSRTRRSSAGVYSFLREYPSHRARRLLAHFSCKIQGAVRL